MPTAKSKFNVALFVIIAIAAVILAGGLLIYQQLTSSNARLNRELMEMNAEKKKIEHELSMEPQLKRERKALMTQLSSLDSQLVDYKYIPTYLTQLQMMANKSGNILRSISPKLPQPFDPQKSTMVMGKAGKKSPTKGESKTGYWLMQIDLNVEGDYNSVLSMLDALRVFPKLIYVRTISLQPNMKDGKERVAARIETYAVITPSQYLSPDDVMKSIRSVGFEEATPEVIGHTDDADANADANADADANANADAEKETTDENE